MGRSASFIQISPLSRPQSTPGLPSYRSSVHAGAQSHGALAHQHRLPIDVKVDLLSRHGAGEKEDRALEREMEATARLVSGAQQQLYNERHAWGEERVQVSQQLQMATEAEAAALKRARAAEMQAAEAESRVKFLMEQQSATARREEMRVAVKIAKKRQDLQKEVCENGYARLELPVTHPSSAPLLLPRCVNNVQTLA